MTSRVLTDSQSLTDLLGGGWRVGGLDNGGAQSRGGYADDGRGASVAGAGSVALPVGTGVHLPHIKVPRFLRNRSSRAAQGGGNPYSPSFPDEFGGCSSAGTAANLGPFFQGMPTTRQIKDELNRERHRTTRSSVLRNTVFLLLVAAAAAILVVTLWMPVLRVYGVSMNPGLSDGNVVVTVKTASYSRGDVIAFYYNNKILVKRVIATSGQTVDIDDDGVVKVNGEVLDEPYVETAALGDCDITFPYTVPDSRVFVLGDNRSVSVDSRSSQIGCVSDEQIVGRLLLRVWPLTQLAGF